jgi:membrane protein implicated in regulation of membrane protease activity
MALVMASVGIVVWFAMPDGVWLLRTILVLTIALVAGTFFDRARFPGASRTESTMGPDGDVLIRFQARVISVTPLKVEARGSVWSARLAAGAPAVSAQAFVEIVGREGLTLLVRASEVAGAK